MENAAYTLELMLKKAMEDNPETAGAVMDKAKHRILKVSSGHRHMFSGRIWSGL